MFNHFLIAESSWLKWIVGNDPEVAGEPVLEWANLPESWFAIVFIAILLAAAFIVMWLYLREIDTCPRPIKILLGCLRFSVILLLILLLLKPIVFYQQIDETKPVITMLRDASNSFAKGDEYQDEDLARRLAEASGLPYEKVATGEAFRNEIFDKAIAKDQQAIVQAMRDKGSIRVVDFSESLEAVAVIPAIAKKASDSPRNETEPGDEKSNDEAGENSQSPDRGLITEQIPPLNCEGRGSDIANALRQTLETDRLSAIVLVSDGQNTTSEDPVEIAQLAAERNIPIYVVGIGEANPPKDLKIVGEPRTPSVAFPDEPFEIKTQVQATSLSEDDPLPDSIDVELLQTKLDKQGNPIGNPTSIQTIPVNIPKDRRTFKVVMSHTMNQPGRYSYTVRLPVLDDEINAEDNVQDSSPVTVEDKKYKVLLISGLPNWDYQQVYRFLDRDQTVELSCWLQSMDETRVQEGKFPISYLPRSATELSKYDVIIMMDPNPEEFDEAWMKALKEFCKDNAGGLLYMAGPHFTTEFVTMNRLKLIREILPVRFDDVDRIAISQDLADAKAEDAGRMLVVPSKLEHPVMSFNADRDESANIWSRLPNILWNFPTLSAKPTSEVLLERGDNLSEKGNQPLMVSGRYGSGLILYMGFQGTWRWRSVGLQAEHFDDFWMLSVRYLFQNNSLQGDSRGLIDTTQNEYELGSKVSMFVEVRDERRQGLTAPTINAIISDDAGRRQIVELQREPGQDDPETNDGRYSGSYSAARLGQFTISLDLGPDMEKFIKSKQIQVVAPSVETDRNWLNEKKLRNIAEQSGGRYFTIDQLAELPKELPRKVETMTFNGPSKPLWDFTPSMRYLAFALPILLLGIEWTLRKWYKLL
jgi:hypothetical protein